MGSIYVTWEGTCRDKTVQEELTGYLTELAERSASLLRTVSKPARPSVVELMTAAREQTSFSMDPIRIFNQEIQGNIVLDPCLARDAQGLLSDVQRANTEMFEVEAGGLEKREAFCLNLNPSSAQYLLRLSRLELFGIDFQLFDPWRLYPNADRISFVFLQSHDLPALSGCLAQVEQHEQCQPYASEAIRAADWFVSAPTIHLRYYLESWCDSLLSWVKHFFVPDLYYRRYEEMSQFQTNRDLMENDRAEHGIEVAKSMGFQRLVQTFQFEAETEMQKVVGSSNS